MHPLLTLAATRPELLAEHAQAYAGLVTAELPRAAAQWKRRAVLHALALLGLLLALAWAGVAALLAATLPGSAMPAPWLLWALPAAPAVAALAAAGVARMGAIEPPPLDTLRQQLQADVALLRRVLEA